MLTVLTMVTGVSEVFLASMIRMVDISVLAIQAQVRCWLVHPCAGAETPLMDHVFGGSWALIPILDTFEAHLCTASLFQSKTSQISRISVSEQGL